jgi:hypothetical protein
LEHIRFFIERPDFVQESQSAASIFIIGGFESLRCNKSGPPCAMNGSDNLPLHA